MNILITGANGFVGRNLVESLKCIRDGKDRTRPQLKVDDIFCYDIESAPEELDEYTAKTDFVFNLAGVNRPSAATEEERKKLFEAGNFGFASELLELLKKHRNTCPVMLSSSIQASLEGRYAGSDYGRSKKEGEELFFRYGEETGAKVLVYRFPNLFGKWCRPNYNSVVATFCYNISHDLPIQISDRSNGLDLLYIDDLVAGLLDALEGNEQYDGRFACIPVTHHVTLGEIADLLYEFEAQPKTLCVPEIPDGSFAKKLYSTYLSYLPKEKTAFELKSNADERGSFTELLKTVSGGQFSVNVSRPGITKGQHWHHSKWEFFIVVKGEALIQERKIVPDNGPVIAADGKAAENEVLEFRVSGTRPTAVHMLPGYTHNIINLSDTEELITLMWANESFDPGHPDTFFEKVTD